MPLPTLPTTEEIRDRIVSDIESQINQTVPLMPRAFIRVWATATAFVFTLLYKFGQWTYKQIFTQTQDIESLLLKGDQFNIPRVVAQAATVTIDLIGDTGTIVPINTEFRGNSNNLLYRTIETIEITAGTGQVNVTCLTAGEISNLLVTDTLTINSPIAGLDNQATVSAIVTEGEDQETLEAYRARISEREKRPPQGGALVDYKFWAKEVPGVTRAFAWGKREVPALTAGYIRVYPLTDGEVDRIPTAAKLTEVQEYIDDPGRAPLQVPIIEVLAMTERLFTITVSSIEPDTAEVRNTFETNVTDFLFTREPKQFLDQIDIKSNISRSYIESIAIDSGANSIVLKLFIDGVGPAIESYTLQYNELALLDILTFS